MTAVNYSRGQIQESMGEQWQPSHVRAMECRELEKVIRVGLHLFESIRLADEEWSRAVQDCKAEFSAQIANEYLDLYLWWLAPCDELLKKIQKMEAEPYGFDVEKAAEFRSAWRTAKQLTLAPRDALLEAA